MDLNVSTTPGFCPDCGSILPLLKMSGNVTCYNCKNEHPPTGDYCSYIFYWYVRFANNLPTTCFVRFQVILFGNMSVEYTINFNRRVDAEEQKSKVEDEQMEEGPTVERRCPGCGNDKMSYATIQLRSVDEGQTVFYTCTKCNFKESENS